MQTWVVKRILRPFDRIWQVSALTLALFLAALGMSFSKELAKERPPSEPELMMELRSPRLSARASAVQSLLRRPVEQLTESVKAEILELYAAELKKWRRASLGQLPKSEVRERSQEAYVEYFGGLGALVMRVGGERAWRLIIESPSQPMSGSNSELAAKGTKVLPPVLNRLAELRTFKISAGPYRGPDFSSQMAMADILGQMLVLNRESKLTAPVTASDEASIRRALRPYLSSSNRDVRFWAASALALAKDTGDAGVIRQVFARKLSSPHPIERMIALQKLARVSDPAFIPTETLKKVARQDPYNGPVPKGVKAGPFPIRSQAESILKKLHVTQ